MKKTVRRPVLRKPSRRTAMADIQELQDRLEEAEETIDALRRGAVDAVVVHDQDNHQVYSLTGADQPYRVYVERMQEGAVTVSGDGVILFCNLRFAEMVESSLERVIGSLITAHLPADTWLRLAQVVTGDGGVVKERAEMNGLAARQTPVLLTASELPLGDHRVLCLVVTDLSEQEENVRLRTAKEEAENASMAKDHFFAALSHELRTPLKPVLMTLSALEADSSLRADVRADVLMMKRNIELETKLVDDLLDLNRIATGKLKLVVEAVDLNEAVRQACDICRSQEGNEHVQFEFDFDSAAGSVAADPSRLHQVLWNVLKNSIKFARDKGPIRVSTRKLPAGLGEVRVQDQGIGISAAALPRIFDAFEQGGANITRQFGGLGLGLAISRAIIDRHEGSIRAESDGLGHGATFIIEIPACDADPAAEQGDALPEARPHDRRLRLLVVEDHADTLRTLTRLLTRAGFDVLGVSNVKRAVEVATTERFDLVLSDLGLPDGSGYEVMRRVRSLRDVPGIAMSGYGMDNDLQRSREAGFSEHLTKPVEFAALRRAIVRLASGASVVPESET
ncbi:MAG: response regulator [Prosthecobacter sp.]|jgi:signal transduction histidine kinase/ActR/RegA family two-component response regulator|uniref:hybrid sensor histidine kinase/response regulator n=1 Tax=Prosthecobacter sp. TaxID=1965333 RepID=UPI0019E8F14E|nr:ATP-binding protein [Prosthecobacter sp.]MBE2283861.1 response regulator [Prosthecobacter sp.]